MARESSTVLQGFLQLGRYFQLISIIPAAVIVASVTAIVASGAPGSQPSWDRIGETISNLGFPGFVALSLATLVIGMLMHPFQMAAIQLLEGSWGPTALGRTAMFSRARIHLERRTRLAHAELRSERQAGELERLCRTPGLAKSELRNAERAWVAAAIDTMAFSAALSRYPASVGPTMPTRLGNTLRRFEDLAGEPYGLDAAAVVPHLMQLADPRQAGYVNDTRTELDLAVRFVISWFVVALASFVLLWPYGQWLILPLVAYALVCISYRAAVRAAEEYGHALCVLLDLSRHELLRNFLSIEGGDEGEVATAREISTLARRQRVIDEA